MAMGTLATHRNVATAAATAAAVGGGEDATPGRREETPRRPYERVDPGRASPAGTGAARASGSKVLRQGTSETRHGRLVQVKVRRGVTNFFIFSQSVLEFGGRILFLRVSECVTSIHKSAQCLRETLSQLNRKIGCPVRIHKRLHSSLEKTSP